MQRAEIIVGARRRERHAELLVGVEYRRLLELVLYVHDEVRHVIGVDPGEISCVRYKAICKELAANPARKYEDCMNVLSSVENKTLWSVVMDNKNCTGYIAVKGKFNHYYKFSFN